MRKLGLKHSLTAQLFKAGLNWQAAQSEGANPFLWQALQDRFGDERNIPESEWLGSHHCESPAFAHTPSGYSF